MASSLIGALRVVLGIDTASFETGLAKAKKQMGGFQGGLSGFAAAFSPVAAGAAAGTLAVAGFAAAMRQAATAAQWADDLSTQANKIGITAESLQLLRQAAEAVDIPMASLDAGMQALNGTLGALKLGIGDGKIRKAFEELGISQEQLTSMKDASDLLPVLADKIRGVGTQAEQVLIAKKLGIEELLPLLQQGAAGIQGMSDKFRDMGLVLNEETVQRLADMNEQMRIADERSRMAGLGLGAEFVPFLVQAKNALADAQIALANYIETLKRMPRIGLLGAVGKLLNGGDQPDWSKFEAPNRDFVFSKPSSPKAKKSKKAKANEYGTIQELTADQDRIGKDWGLIETEKKLKDIVVTSTYQGINDGLEKSRTEITDSYRDAISGGLYAAVYGGGKGLMEYLADTFRRRFIDNLATSLADVLASGFGGSSKSGGGIGGTILNIGKKLFGFANGGSFQVGGVGGIDSQLVAFKASPNERVSITKPGQDMGGGAVAVHVTPSPYFDVAVQRIAAPMAASAAMGGAAIAERRMQRRSRRAI